MASTLCGEFRRLPAAPGFNPENSGYKGNGKSLI